MKAEASGDQNNSNEAELKENALSDTEIKVLTKTVVAEGEQSVAIDQAQATVINTGVVHGDIINVALLRAYRTQLSQPITSEPHLI